MRTLNQSRMARHSFAVAALLVAAFMATLNMAAQETIAVAEQPVSKTEQPQRLRTPEENLVEGQYIVVLRNQSVDRRGLVEQQTLKGTNPVAELAKEHKLTIKRDWTSALPAFAVEMDANKAKLMADDWRVRFVEQVSLVQLQNFAPECNQASHPSLPDPGFPSSPQVIQCDDPSPSGTGCQDNWGLDRIDEGDINPANRNGLFAFPSSSSPLHLYLFDTGLTPGHQELLGANGQSRLGSGINATADPLDPDRYNFTDTIGNSHGTHVSGISAGKTFGVAKYAIIHPIKVNLGNFVSTMALMDGIHWIMTTHPAGQPAAANLSANGTGFPDSEALALALRSLIQFGVTFVESAGNQNGQAANYSMVGGKYPEEILIVGASTVQDERWARPPNDPFCQDPASSNNCASNFGSAVDLFAPGEDIVSSSNHGSSTACSLTGTSMAAPHATGTSGLLLQRFPNAQPSAVAKGLKRAATFGTLNPSTLNGSPNLLLHTNFPSAGPPVAGSDLFFTEAETPLTIFFSELLAGDFDWNNQTLIVDSLSNPGNGSITQTSDSVTYTPNMGFSGDDSFQYTIRDSSGNFDSALVRINVGDLDRPPVAVDDFLETMVDQDFIFRTKSTQNPAWPYILENDFDPEPNSSVIVFDDFVTNPQHGTVTQRDPLQSPDGSWRYTPDPGYSGPDQFRYRIRDQSGQFGEATVHIDVGEPPAQVSFIAGYTPNRGAARQEYASTSPNPPVVISYYHDPNLGRFEERPGGICQNGSNNPTYLTVRVESSQPVDSCSYLASWDGPTTPIPCTQQIVDAVNAGNEFILNTDDFLADIPTCREKIPLQPHVRYNIEHWFHATLVIDGIAYERRIRFKKNSDVRYLDPTADTFISEANPAANFGSASNLQVRSWTTGDTRYAFIKFQLSGLPGTIASARLQMETQSNPITDLWLYQVCSSNWSESQLNWNNWEDMTDGSCGLVETLNGLPAMRGFTFDVSPVVGANGSYTFGIATNDTRTQRRMGARESFFDTPRLIVTLER